MKRLGEIDGIPVIRIRTEDVKPNSSYPGAMLISFWCPYCRRKHQHGARGWDGSPTHRHAHCDAGKGRPFEERGYMLATDEGWGSATALSGVSN